jgi:hypothetical protein
MNTDYILMGVGLLGLLTSMTVLWSFWIAVWGVCWRRRTVRKWQAEVMGVLAGVLFPLTVPAASVAIRLLWLRNEVQARARHEGNSALRPDGSACSSQHCLCSERPSLAKTQESSSRWPGS